MGVVQAFLTTRSFSKIYSQEELMVRLAEAMAYIESALQELEVAESTIDSECRVVHFNPL